MADIVTILTALDLEYKAVLRHLEEVKQYRHGSGTRFETGLIRGTHCRVALGLTGVGNQASAVIAERALREFSPLAVLFVGVAGSLWQKPELGDVVVAERVYAYHGGTSEDSGLKARPRVWEAPHEISQLAHQLDRAGDWRKRLPADFGTPGLRFGAIAAGEIVQYSSISAEAKWIRDHYNDAIAIEMEGAGVAHAAHLNNAMVGIVRGISDMADSGKAEHSDLEWQPRAAANAAGFAVRLAEELINERKELDMEPGEAKPADHGTVTNLAFGDVGAQIGTMNGDFTQTSAVPAADRTDDLAAAVAQLRTCLERAHATGEVDNETYEAAEKELDDAESALRKPDTKSRKQASIPLKKLRGLTADTAEIAAKVASVITAVGSLS